MSPRISRPTTFTPGFWRRALRSSFVRLNPSFHRTTPHLTTCERRRLFCKALDAILLPQGFTRSREEGTGRRARPRPTSALPWGKVAKLNRVPGRSPAPPTVGHVNPKYLLTHHEKAAALSSTRRRGDPSSLIRNEPRRPPLTADAAHPCHPRSRDPDSRPLSRFRVEKFLQIPCDLGRRILL